MGQVKRQSIPRHKQALVEGQSSAGETDCAVWLAHTQASAMTTQTSSGGRHRFQGWPRPQTASAPAISGTETALGLASSARPKATVAKAKRPHARESANSRYCHSASSANAPDSRPRSSETQATDSAWTG